LAWRRAAESQPRLFIRAQSDLVRVSSGNSAPLPPQRQGVGLSSTAINRASVFLSHRVLGSEPILEFVPRLEAPPFRPQVSFVLYHQPSIDGRREFRRGFGARF
jgi:hypothetical protein